MSVPEVIVSLVTGLCGGLLVKALDWLQFAQGFKTQQRAEFLKQQLANLYGPLYLLARENHYLCGMNQQIEKLRDVLREYLWMSDRTDRALLECVIEDMTRVDIELDISLRGRLPRRITREIDNIAFWREDVLPAHCRAI